MKQQNREYILFISPRIFVYSKELSGKIIEKLYVINEVASEKASRLQEKSIKPFHPYLSTKGGSPFKCPCLKVDSST